ncbi:MAG: serine/threonine-protein kinase PknK [Planctomycetota bacterium]|nr:MAG: serine/threonine-protein kinase PknK [Planctomycetota bacterium]
MARESSSDHTSGRDAFRTPISRFIVSSGAERPRVEQEYEPGSTIANRYLVDKTLGVGGMCTVYLVGDKTRKDRPVALKLVAGETNSVRIETFRNEFRILSHLEHENLIRVFDFGVLGADGGFYYTAEYIDGKDLREAAAGVPEETLVDYIVQACRGLEYVHSRGYIHYDVKSGNILVTGDGVVKLTDFGLSALAGRGLGKRIRGTPAYTSPEIIMMADVDARADLYSLGVTLYEIVAGTQPFRTRDLHDLFHKHVAEAPTPPRSVNPDVPEYLEQIILRLLAKNPADRFGSANAVIAELARFVEGEIELQPASSVEGYLRTPPLCGREKEMNQAAFALGQLGKGSGRHVVIEGVKGIGRTRLLREIFYSAQIEGYAAVFGRGSEPGLFSSLADSLKSFPQIESLDHPGSEGGEDGRSVPEGAAAAKSALPDALARIIAASEQTPVVICIDDLQDADTYSQKAIKRLSQLLATSSAPPLLLITSFRNDGGSPGTYAPGVLRLSLGPLDRGEIGEAVSRMFGQSRAPEIFVSRLADSTGGVPHAVVETVRMLVASGNITLVEGKWHFRGGVEVRGSLVAGRVLRLAGRRARRPSPQICPQPRAA